MRSALVPVALPILGLALAGCPAPVTDDSAPAPPAPFTLLVLPDTQYYPLDYPGILDAMLAWAVTSAPELGTAFLLHEGDLTHQNSAEEWAAVRHAFDQIEGAVPYAACVGNHDEIEDPEHTAYDAAFPVAAAEGLPWFGGSLRSDSLDTSWYTFEGGGLPWLVISLPYGPDDDELAWASAVLDAHPDHRAIVLTHAHLQPDGELGSAGIRIWNALEQHPGFAFVLNGHYTAGESAYRVQTSAAGTAVHQLFFNVQDRWFGGQGLLRTLRFDPVEGTVTVRTYSPWTDWYEEAEEHDFVLSGVDLGPVR